MRSCADCPIDMRMMTEAKPMTMPSMVKIERILPCKRLRVDVMNASRSNILFEKFFLRVARFFDRLVAFHDSILETDDAISKFRGVCLVRNKNNGTPLVVEGFQNFHDLRT